MMLLERLKGMAMNPDFVVCQEAADEITSLREQLAAMTKERSDAEAELVKVIRYLEEGATCNSDYAVASSARKAVSPAPTFNERKET